MCPLSIRYLQYPKNIRMRNLTHVLLAFILFSCSHQTKNVPSEETQLQDSIQNNSDTSILLKFNPSLDNHKSKKTYQNTFLKYFKSSGYNLDSGTILNANTYFAKYKEKPNYKFHNIAELIPCHSDSCNFMRILVDSNDTEYLCQDFYLRGMPRNEPPALLLSREAWITKSKISQYVDKPTSARLYFYGPENNLYKIGNTKHGKKDGVWFTYYEDYPWPKFEFYENDIPQIGRFPIKIYDDKNRLWIDGKLTTELELKISSGDVYCGTIIRNLHQSNLKIETEYIGLNLPKRDTILVKFKTYKLTSNNLIDSSKTLFWGEMRQSIPMDSLIRGKY